jgi:hypothetical protein
MDPTTAPPPAAATTRPIAVGPAPVDRAHTGSTTAKTAASIMFVTPAMPVIARSSGSAHRTRTPERNSCR